MNATTTYNHGLTVASVALLVDVVAQSVAETEAISEALNWVTKWTDREDDKSRHPNMDIRAAVRILSDTMSNEGAGYIDLTDSGWVLTTTAA